MPSISGPIAVWINSPGGDCVAAAQIYNMLMEYRRRPSGASAEASRTAPSAPQMRNTGCGADGAQTDVTVRIDGIATSAASSIAMTGTKVQMSPVSVMMIHNPLTVAMRCCIHIAKLKICFDASAASSHSAGSSYAAAERLRRCPCRYSRRWRLLRR